MHLHYSSSTAKSRLWQFAVAFKCLLIGFLGETSEIICSYCCLSIWKRLEGHFQSIKSKSLYSEKDYSGISPHLVWTEHAKTLLSRSDHVKLMAVVKSKILVQDYQGFTVPEVQSKSFRNKVCRYGGIANDSSFFQKENTDLQSYTWSQGLEHHPLDIGKEQQHKSSIIML